MFTWREAITHLLTPTLVMSLHCKLLYIDKVPSD